jgi:hypothetical protein
MTHCLMVIVHTAMTHCLMVIVHMAMTHFSTIILTFCDWLHWIRMKPHGWWVNCCAFFMLGEIILCCCYWYFASSGNQRVFTLQMDSDVRGDSVSPNRSLFCSWMGIQIGCIQGTCQIECDTDWLYLRYLLDWMWIQIGCI